MGLLTSFLAHNVQAAEPKDHLTPEQQLAIQQMQNEKALIDQRTELIKSQTALRDAKIAEQTPVTGKDLVAPSGNVEGAKELDFAMYMASMESLASLGRQVCRDLQAAQGRRFVITNANIGDAIARDATFGKYRVTISDQLSKANGEAAKLLQTMEGKAAAGNQVEAASVAAVAAGIDVAGIIKGAAGLASLFKVERTISAKADLLGAAEVQSMLSMCNGNAPNVVDLDADYQLLVEAVANVTNDLKAVADASHLLSGNLRKIKQQQGALQAAITKSSMDAQLRARLPSTVDEFLSAGQALVDSSKKFLDSMYTADAVSGISPVVAAARNRVFTQAILDGDARILAVTLLKWRLHLDHQAPDPQRQGGVRGRRGCPG